MVLVHIESLLWLDEGCPLLEQFPTSAMNVIECNDNYLCIPMLLTSVYVPSDTSTEYALSENAGGGSKTSTKFIVSVVSVNLSSDPPSYEITSNLYSVVHPFLLSSRFPCCNKIS